MKTLKTIIFIIMISYIMPLWAQNKVESDSVPNNKEVKNRNVMLNASADNQPRQVSVGLPDEDSATIFEDGTLTTSTWWPMMSYFYWANSSMYSHVGMKSLSENVITTGAVNYSVDSWTREGKNVFEGDVLYKTNIFGLQRLGISLVGPIRKGWSYSISSYTNLDPGINKLSDAALQDNMKQLKIGITKTLKGQHGHISLFYKYTFNKEISDATGPFVFVGDGSVKEYNGFRLGKDGFLPANGQITYEDVITGRMVTIQRNKGMSALGNDVSMVLNYIFRPNLNLNVMSKYHYANIFYDGLSMAGIGKASASDGYTYAYDTGLHSGGEVFTGNFATRYLIREIAHERAWYNAIKLIGSSPNNRHNWRAGFNFWWVMPDNVTSSGIYTHTVEVDPYWLKHNNSQGSDFNTGGEYYDTHETKTALYASDDWKPSDHLWFSAGMRMEYHTLGGRNALSSLNTNAEGVDYPENVRSIGWSLTKARTTALKEKWFSPSAQLNIRYTIAHGFGTLAEGIFSVSSLTSPNFSGSEMPNNNAIDTYFGRIGIFWNNKWIQLISQLSYIKKTNYQRLTQFTNPNDASDIVTLLMTYGVQTTGWTTDIMLNPFKGFTFHGLFTLQNPKFKDFNLNVNFKDGSATDYNFTNNMTTGVSKVLIELDPSYCFGHFSLWSSFRYQSKQYINRTNTLYFNGRWETFAGLDYHLNKSIAFSLNVVNLFNMKGASGNISSADLVKDVSQYHNYLMAGTYIRPFTIELSTQIKF
jgi:hypothetical protein